MAKFSCFSALVGKKKYKKGFEDVKKGNGTLPVKLEHHLVGNSLSQKESSNLTFFDVPVPFATQGESTCKVKVIREENSTETEAGDESLSIKRDLSETQVADNGDETDPSGKKKMSSCDSMADMIENRVGGDDVGLELIQSGHVSESFPLSRVVEWVRSLETHSAVQYEDRSDDEGKRENYVYPPSPMIIPHTPLGSNHNLSEDVYNVIRSLNSLSTVAHIACMGLKVIPNIAPFSSLRSVDLSGNFIVHIAPGSLPKGLHTLNLSRNKITAIEALRELTRLRVLDLSYNRISRIGHGLSNCRIMKELYLAGNNISEVEGLHRLLKLKVVDLSFNKITTPQALDQLVPNYNSLLAVNLLGNPIQSNLGDDELRKAVSSLLPHLTYLNKQLIKPQREREVATNSASRAALGRKSAGRRASSRRHRHRPKSNHQRSRK